MKNFFKYGAFGLLAIGLLFGKYLGRWIINVIDNSDTRVNNGKPYVQRYLNDCDTVQLFMNNFSKKVYHFQVKGAFDLSKDDNTVDLEKWPSIFFDQKTKRYFCPYYFFSRNSFFSQMYGSFLYEIAEEGANITATINKKELEDPSYGTKQKPVPIIYYYVPGKMNNFYEGVTDQGDKNDRTGFHGNKAEFRAYMSNYNALHYLSYVKSKADFEKMFGKQPEKKKWWQF